MQKLDLNLKEKTLTVPKNETVCYCIEDYDIEALVFMTTVKIHDNANRDNSSNYFIGNKVAAIKYLRLRFGVGLKEAKDAVELFMKTMEEAKREAEALKPVSSLGALLREKFDASPDKTSIDIHGYIQSVFRLIGRGSWQTSDHDMRNKIMRFYDNGNSAQFAADYFKDSYNL